MTAKPALKIAATTQQLIRSAQPVATVALPAALAEVALIDAETCAAAGGMSVSWWHEECRAGRAPSPVIRRPRCTRWSLASVREFWIRFAEAGAVDTEAGDAMKAKLAKASAKAQSLRAVSEPAEA